MHCISPIRIGLLLFALVLAGTGPCRSQVDLREVGRISAPNYSPSDEDIISFERQTRRGTEIWIWSRSANAVIAQIPRARPDRKADFFGDGTRSAGDRGVVAAELEWCPVVQGDNSQWFVYVSGEEKSLDLYLACMDDLEAVPIRLTSDPDVDEHPRWSPDGSKIAFTSSRTGNGDIYVIDNIRDILRYAGHSSRIKPRLRRVTTNRHLDVYPCWSPDGRWIAYSSLVAGEHGGSHDIVGVPFPGAETAEPVLFTNTPEENETRPSWSPSGRFIVFYSTRRGDKERYRINAVRVRTSGRTLRAGLPAGRLSAYVRDKDVIFPLSGSISWAYSTKDDYIAYTALDQDSNYGIWVVDMTRWSGSEGLLEYENQLLLKTLMNREPRFSRTSSELCYVYLENSRDTLGFYDDIPIEIDLDVIEPPIRKGPCILRSMILPGWGQSSSGSAKRGLAMIFSSVAAVAWATYAQLEYASYCDDARAARGDYLEARHPDIIQEKYDEWQSRYDSAKRWRDRRDISIGCFAAVYTISLLECMLRGDPHVTDGSRSGTNRILSDEAGAFASARWRVNWEGASHGPRLKYTLASVRF